MCPLGAYGDSCSSQTRLDVPPYVYNKYGAGTAGMIVIWACSHRHTVEGEGTRYMGNVYIIYTPNIQYGW